MNKLFWVLCVALYPAAATATNFETCMTEAKTNHTDAVAEGYTAYTCEGTTAEKLLARPDECEAGSPKPLLSSLNRQKKQFEYGLYSQLTWRAGRCSGSCEAQSYDSKDTTYKCELRVYNSGPAPPTGVNREPATRTGEGTEAAAPRQGPRPDSRPRSRRLVRADRWLPPPRQYPYDRPVFREPACCDDRLVPPGLVPDGYSARRLPQPPAPPDPPWCDCPPY
jgi:hypothetical protein